MKTYFKHENHIKNNFRRNKEMKKLLCLVLTICMLSAGATVFAAAPGDAYLESYPNVVVSTVTDEDFSADLEGWTKRGNAPVWMNEAGPDGELGYMRVNPSGGPSINKTYTLGADNINGRCRISFKVRASKATTELKICHNGGSNFNKPYIKSANTWIEYDICFKIQQASQQFIITSDSSDVVFDIDDFKLEIFTDDLSTLKVGTYTIPHKVWQNSNDAVSGKVISVLYSADNEMLDVDAKDFETTGNQGEFVAVNTEIDIPSGLEAGASIKNFLWDGYSNIMAYCDSNKLFDGADVFNGGFEIKAKNSADIAEGWKARNDTPVTLTTDAHSGEYAVKFDGTSTGIISSMGARKALGSITPSADGAKLKFWAKTEGTNPYPKLTLYLTNNSGNQNAGTSATIGTTWAEYTIPISTTYAWSAFISDLFLYPAGDGNNANTTFYVDDIRIVTVHE